MRKVDMRIERRRVQERPTTFFTHVTLNGKKQKEEN